MHTNSCIYKEREIIVGDIKDDVLLGMDIETMDVLPSTGIVILNGIR